MLKSTFQHLKGIGKKTERSLWAKGIITWDDYRSLDGRLLSVLDDDQADHALSESEKAYEQSNMAFFGDRLPTSEYYRIALEYPEDVIFLDIETTGLSLYYDQITIVGWSIGCNFGVYLSGQDDSQLRSALASAKVIVTFNGIMFDLKFLNKHLDALVTPPVHLDLRFFSRRVGLTGGQKAIEKEIGFERGKELEDMLGEAAPILWHKYRRGDNEALKRLIEYNHADVEGMKAILDEDITRFYKLDNIPKKIQKKVGFSKKKSKIKWARKKTKETGAYKIFIEDFKGSVKPLITYYDLNNLCPLDNVCIIGIDLVSSEERETGYCILKGNMATTSRLKTDTEMIDLAIKSGVTLVSIDSPLSIPRGRTSYFDDDPNRAFGITRLCERQLKKRGINSYPALIPSMQKLTQRGVELAKKFRKLGIPVIESYPGAAQDIMSIPRKQAGLKYLTDGMAEFGIKGAFTSEEVSHDELDAITSAIVGYFYWSGMYEGLGDEVEDYLIIPDLNADADKWLNRKVIGISGEIAAGKTTIANYLSSQGYSCSRYSMVLRDLLEKQAIEVNRSSLQKIGQKINEEKGQRWLGNLVINKVEDKDTIVIDGIRFLEDTAYLSEIFGPSFVHIHVETADDVRKNRIRRKNDENLSLEQASMCETEREIEYLRNIATVVENNDGLDNLYKKIDQIVGEL